jgi:hypothetical protein
VGFAVGTADSGGKSDDLPYRALMALTDGRAVKRPGLTESGFHPGPTLTSHRTASGNLSASAGRPVRVAPGARRWPLTAKLPNIRCDIQMTAGEA